MLQRAVECVNSVDLWLALAKLEPYERAKAVLNQARKANKTNPQIWIASAELQESVGNLQHLDTIIARAVSSLPPEKPNEKPLDTRARWFQFAHEAEKADHLAVCRSIVKHAIKVGLENSTDAERRQQYIDDAHAAIAASAINTGRAIYHHATVRYPQRKALWLQAVDLERVHGTPESLDQILQRAVSYCPKAEVLWLMAAKNAWLGSSKDDKGNLTRKRNPDGARAILSDAFKSLPQSEAIWIAYAKVEEEEGEIERARILLSKARDTIGKTSYRIWMKSAMLERGAREYLDCVRLLREAVEMHPNAWKLWAIWLQLTDTRYHVSEDDENLSMNLDIKEEPGQQQPIRRTYQAALAHCPHAIPLWIIASNIELNVLHDVPRARAVLERGRSYNKDRAGVADLTIASVRLEIKHGSRKQAESALSAGLTQFPKSGAMWALAIELTPPTARRAKAVQALSQISQREKDKEKSASANPEEGIVLVAVAKGYWADRDLDKSRAALRRAVALNPDFGDAWATFLAFEKEHGTQEAVEEIVARCVKSEPRHGEMWVSVSKAVENVTMGGSRLSTSEILHKVAGRITCLSSAADAKASTMGPPASVKKAEAAKAEIKGDVKVAKGEMVKGEVKGEVKREIKSEIKKEMPLKQVKREMPPPPPPGSVAAKKSSD
eukprot:NODE_274_length_2339_cov_26.015721_g215_i0.p1 GENE.NODE_274_length_2339_cov_26.015721_g215_i0~~NODE_274_length_2339_cov_26.015721_g215_i0.p1  ORF type:complete len:732 (+),score=287.92 NODE_274_length_2339_cov_26.015721_g215_i0:198-2198(+)